MISIKIDNFKFFFVLTACVLFSINVYCEPHEKEIKDINNSLIYDLYINYELTEKNGNLPLVIDFLPRSKITNYKAVTLTSNVGDEDQVVRYVYKNNGSLSSVIYTIGDRKYKYDFVYKEGRIIRGDIAGKLKIKFEYDQKGRLNKIIRYAKSSSYEHLFTYDKKERKVAIELIFVTNENRKSSSRKYYASWNSELKLESYCFDVYCKKNMKYTSQGNLLSFSFDDNKTIKWEYSVMDEKGNWTERKIQEILFRRVIEYK